ncbi:Uncharacterised protein [Mycobacterium tuberculosis]|uniref:Uncharacterized protein n=1 Tax=Mycobacterium tuberculosis TaxID=1773 RepID=A0A0T9G5T6_MYCTX|nr:Uncharacterised protein [Mycobacterium tuberculosis]COW51505.1 Uncharacterised protein [Mycobacterium tuberculosis]COX44907.1 Uncharacterised protein [Mycobacterium tuberculosis]COZ54618.1 Uncharacterised protein [Mycobacterium tuberculosis]
MYAIEAGQHRGVVFGVVVCVRLFALELPVGDQPLEIGVDGTEIAVSGSQHGRIGPVALLGKQVVEPHPAAGTDPQRRGVDQEAGRGQPVDGRGDVGKVFTQGLRQVGGDHPALEPHGLQYRQLAHELIRCAMSASSRNSGVSLSDQADNARTPWRTSPS